MKATEELPMTQLAQELDLKLRTLDPIRAQYLMRLVRDALTRAEKDEIPAAGSEWPAGYFNQTSGVLAGEPFERPPQGDLPNREPW